MAELATAGNIVIVGRAGQVILHDWPQVFHLRVNAPKPVRIQRVAADQGITLAQAQAQVQASDSFRRKYLKQFYAVDWEDPAWYDLTVNTARLEPAGAASAVCRAFSEFLNSHHWQEKFAVDHHRETSP
jgi:cytidylate kinase